MNINLALLALLSARVVDIAARQGPSDNLLNFLSVFHGYFSNQKQIELNNVTKENHPPVMSITFLPVEVPAFSPSITFFMEEVGNGVIYLLQLLVISEEDGGIIRIQRYPLPGQYSPGTYDLNQLNELKASDLHTYAACDVLYQPVDPTVFIGTWPYCPGEVIDDVPPNFVTLMTCTALAFHNPPVAAETSDRLPNVFERVKRYGLLPYMVGERQDFVDSCGYLPAM